MNLCRLTLVQPSNITHIISGHFSHRLSNEFVISFGKYLVLARVDQNEQISFVHCSPVFAKVQALEKLYRKGILYIFYFLFIYLSIFIFLF